MATASLPPPPAGYSVDDLPPPPAGYQVEGGQNKPSPTLAERYKTFGEEHPIVSGALSLVPGLGALAPGSQEFHAGLAKQAAHDIYHLATGPGAGPLGLAAGELADKLGITKKVDTATAAAGPNETAGKYAAIAGEMALPLPKGAEAIEGAIPTAEKAGQKFASVMESAHDLPINVAAPGDVALRTRELAAAGGSMPKVVRDFISRATDPNQGPITYKEARDFYSNATRLSADEAMRLTPVMKRQAALFTQSLGKSIEDAADQVGKLDEYHQAMGEYHTAMRIRSLWQDIKDMATSAAAKSGAAAAGGGVAGAYAIKKLLGQ